MKRFLAVIVTVLLTSLSAAVDAETIHLDKFGGDLGTVRKAATGTPRANPAELLRDRWRDGAETFTLGYVAARGARGSEAFTTGRVIEDQLGQAHVRLSQSIAGLPVVGADLVVHVDAKSGEVLGVNGRFAVDRDLPRAPRVSAGVAIDTAIAAFGIAGARVVGAPELTYIVDDTDQVRLAWSNYVAYVSENGEELDRIFADAVNGAAVARHPQIRRAKNRQIFDCLNQTSWAICTLMFGEGGSSADGTAMAAYNNAGTTYDYFLSKHGRDSMDGVGGVIREGVHFGSSYNNAGWVNNYTAIVYGDGNGTTYSSFPFSLDVVAHEFTHGVVHWSAGFQYTGETGSLDETLADIFGAATEAYSDGSINGDVWKIGDEIYTPGTAGDAIRYLNDPSLRLGYADYYPTRSFNSDLHRNAGIGGLAFYLVVQGGQHPRGPSFHSVTAQGIGVAERIFYRALTVYATSTTNFRQMRDHTLRAADDLYGVNSSQTISMKNAWTAVGNFWYQRISSLSAGTSWTQLSSWSNNTSGWITGQLFGPAGSNFDLFLEKYNSSTATWSVVASRTTASPNEILEYSSAPGEYRWRVQATSGSGSYSLYWNQPF
jgi:Zn-dependent metalloprotease